MTKPTGFVPSALRQPVKPNQLTPIPPGFAITRDTKPRMAQGLEKQRQTVKGKMSQDLNLMTARWGY